MVRRLIFSFATILLLFFLGKTVSAQETTNPPVNVQVTVDQTSLEVDAPLQAVLILRNTTAYTLTNLSAQLQSTTFVLPNTINLTDTLLPYTSTSVTADLHSPMTGIHNLIFTV